jgi:hypothetical protein
MKKGLMILLCLGLIFIILAISACTQQKYLLCADNVTQVLDINDCPKERPKCPLSCDDNNNCTKDSCSSATNYTCVYSEIIPCNGNGICEQAEFGLSADCPASCDDANPCTADSYDYRLKSCLHDAVVPCCGNKLCEAGESYVKCPLDCEKRVEINVTNYFLRPTVGGAYHDFRDNPKYTYIVVDFKIKNIKVDDSVEVDYLKGNGFYFDPFKMKLEDSAGKLYTLETDSDVLKEWRDVTIIPKGDTITGSLLYITPRNLDHLRLVAFDKYGTRVDVSELY